MRESKLQRELKKREPFERVQEEAMLAVLRTADLLSHRFNRLFREHSLTQPQYNVLRILRGEGAPLPSLEIASRMLAQVPAITGVIDRLEKAELVQRKRCNADRRVWYVSITERGSELVASMDEPVHNLTDQLMRHLSEDQCYQLVELLELARTCERTCDADHPE